LEVSSEVETFSRDRKVGLNFIDDIVPIIKEFYRIGSIGRRSETDSSRRFGGVIGGLFDSAIGDKVGGD
jgi:hypothetical protein